MEKKALGLKSRFFLLIMALMASLCHSYGQLRADFSVIGGTGCLPLVVKFNDLSTGNPDRWLWEAGDGRSSTLREPSFLYLVPGEFNIKLTVYKGSTDSATVLKSAIVKVYQFPIIDFVTNLNEGCTPLSVNLTSRSVAGSGSVKRSVWDFGDGSSGQGNQINHIYYQSGNFNVTLTVENEFGCTRSLSLPNLIQVYAPPLADFGFKISGTCPGPFIISFSDSSTGNSTLTYNWNFGNGNISTQKNPTHSYANSGTYPVRLIVTNQRGCADTIIKQINIRTGLISGGFTIADSVCKGQDAAIKSNVQFAGQVDSVQWFFGDGTNSSDFNPSKFYTNSGAYIVKQIVYSGLCSDTTSETIIVKTGPSIDFSGSVTESCKPPLAVSFTSNVQNGQILRWDLGNGSNSLSPTPSTTYDTIGLFTVKLVAQSGNGCIDSLIRNTYIKIQPPVIGNLPPLLFEGCFPYTTTIRPKILTSVPITRWEWDFGDGRTSTDSTPTITYSKNGGYIIKLKVFTNDGCVDSAQTIVRGGARPRFDFKADPLIVCPEDIVTFDDSITTPYNRIRWEFGDGGTSDKNNPKYLYNDTGYMDVRLIVYDNGCSDTVVKEKYIYVSPPISRFNPVLNCLNQFTRKFNDLSISPESWHWDFGTGDTSNLQNPYYTFTDTGKYKVTLTVRYGNCKHESSQDILVLNEKPDFSVDLDVGCKETIGKFNASGSQLHHYNLVEYKWDFGDTTEVVGRDSVVSFTFTKRESIPVKLTIKDLNGCVFDTVKTIEINLRGPVAVIKPPSRFICLNQELVFFDSSITFTNYSIKYWRWNFGDGTDTVFSTPVFRHTYKDTGLFALSVIIEDQSGCIDSLTVPGAIHVLSPIANFTSPDSIICLNAPIRMVNLSTGLGLKYLWHFGQGDSSTNQSPTTYYDTLGLFTVSLKVIDTASCVSVALKPAFINVGGLKANFEMNDSTASCPPLRVSFTNKSTGAKRYLWSFGDGNSSVLKNPSQIYTLAGTFNVKLFIEGSGKCVDSVLKKVVIRGPQGDLLYGPLSGCPPHTVNFTSTAKNIERFIWDYSDGQTSITTDTFSTHTYLNPGNFRPRVILEDDNNCRIPIIGKEVVRVVGVRSLIQSLPNYTFCDSAQIQFTDSSLSNGTIIRWNWDFGDGSTSSVPNPVHLFNKPGRYAVKLTVQTADSCLSIASLPQQIVVAATPKLSLSDSVGLCLPATLSLQPQWLNPDTSSLSINWNFSQGINGNSLMVPPIKISDTGNYLFRMQIINNYGCASTYNTNVRVTEVAEIFFGSLNSLLFCDSGFVRFSPNITATAPIRSLTWDFGDDSTGTGNNPGHWYRSPGLYRVSLRVDAINGCFTQREIPAQIRVAPSPFIAPLSDTSFCVPGRAFMSASLSGADTIPTTWRWNFANGTGATVPNPGWLNLNVPGTYNTWVATRNSFGCTDTMYRQIVAYDTPVVRAGPPAPVCLGSTYTLNPSGADRYEWDANSTLSCTQCSSPVASPQNTTTYRVTGFNRQGCSRSDAVTLRVIPPTPLITGKGDSICVGETIRLFAAGKTSYTWSPTTGLSNGAIANPLASPTQSVTYRLIATNPDNCFPDTAFYPVVVFPRPVVNIIPDRISRPINTMVTLNTESSNVTSYNWTPVTGLSCADCPAPSVALTRSITYRVEADNGGGCPVFDEVLVEPVCLASDLFVPNTFSPNGDGKNDRFFPMGQGVSGIRFMRIFNRWGELVFEKTNFNANDPGAGWDGTYKGRQLTPDVYVFIIGILCHDNKQVDLKGNVTLLR